LYHRIPFLACTKVEAFDERRRETPRGGFPFCALHNYTGQQTEFLKYVCVMKVQLQQRTAMSSPFALRMESLFASSSFRISCSARVRSVELISWEASNAALAVWAMDSALRDMV
jgi:hypothetical protein